MIPFYLYHLYAAIATLSQGIVGALNGGMEVIESLHGRVSEAVHALATSIDSGSSHGYQGCPAPAASYELSSVIKQDYKRIKQNHHFHTLLSVIFHTDARVILAAY